MCAHTWTVTQRHTHTRTRTGTHTHTAVIVQWNKGGKSSEMEEKLTLFLACKHGSALLAALSFSCKGWCVCVCACARCATESVIKRIQENVCCGGRVVSIIATQQEGH